MKKIIATILICINLYSCNNGVSKNELESRVKADIDVEFTKQAIENNVSYRIISFDLVHMGGNEYSGILKTTEDGEEIAYEIYVATDRDTYLWKIVD